MTNQITLGCTVQSKTTELTTSGLHATEIEDDLDSSEPVEGGPKISETPLDEVLSSQFLELVDVACEVQGS